MFASPPTRGCRCGREQLADETLEREGTITAERIDGETCHIEARLVDPDVDAAFELRFDDQEGRLSGTMMVSNEGLPPDCGHGFRVTGIRYSR